jgi:uncharacterized protein
MEIDFDPKKNARNVAQRGLSFERVAEIDLLAAHTLIDDRRDYGEVRYRAFGQLDGRLHAVVYTETDAGIRVISLRRANRREEKRYGKKGKGESGTP